jgi:hypothetical protein
MALAYVDISAPPACSFLPGPGSLRGQPETNDHVSGTSAFQPSPEESAHCRHCSLVPKPDIGPRPEADVRSTGKPLNLASTIMRYSEQSKMVTAAPGADVRTLSTSELENERSALRWQWQHTVVRKSGTVFMGY